MDLFEYEAKQEFSKHNISIPKGALIAKSTQTAQAIAKLKPPYMVKAQVLVGGRGKAGGIISATSEKEAEEAAVKLLGVRIRGLLVKQVLIEEKLSIRKELYLGIAIDRFNRSYVALASATGGVEIEEIASKTPKAIIRTLIDAKSGMRSFDSAAIAKQLGYIDNQLVKLSTIIQKLYQVCIDNDAESVEINPLAETETETGDFVALDARMVIDDNALFRHPEYAAKETEALSPQEALALKNNLAYVKLDGDIGVVGNGAGLVMATLDLLNFFGGKPANFLDLGGGATIEAIAAALQIVFAEPDTKVIIVNVLGGITHCDDVARGIVEAANEAKVKKPLVVRLVGTNQQEGQKILANAGISVLDSMEEAAKQAVEITRGAQP
ncbi:MAG: ADP-forming succinate--CoA ligase subunit beta [Candidatus Bathyarchaeia archaeon]